MSDENKSTEGSSEEFSTNPTSQIGGSSDSEGLSWNDFVKTYGTGGGAFTLNQDSSKSEFSLKEKLSEENAAKIFEEDLRTESPLTPLAFVYEFKLYEKEDVESAEMIGSMREARGEIKTILDSYPRDMLRSFADDMTLWGGWQNLIKHGYEKTKGNNFGEAIQKYINLRVSLLETQQNNLRLTPVEAADMRSLRESFRKTSEIIQRQISSNNNK